MTDSDEDLAHRRPSGEGIQWSYVTGTVARIALPLWFVIFDVLVLRNLAANGFVSIDIVVYREAAQVALSGGDPWADTAAGVVFAGPPPSLLPFIPLALLPLPVAVILATAALGAAAVWSVRRLELPLWWILFPPIFESLVVGNVDVLILALLLVKGPVAGLAMVAKVYGIVPLLLQRRWRAIALGAAVSALTIPLWSMFFANFGGIVGTLDSQSEGFSAWGTWFMVPTVIALWWLRHRGAEWLVVPAVWPHTQTHYGAMSLPVIRHFPIAAVLIGLQTPLAPPLAVIVVAVQTHLRSRAGADEDRRS